MFARLNAYKNLIVGVVIIVLIVGLYFYTHSLKVQIRELRSDLKDSYVELANSKLESSRYKSALDAQSREVELLSVDKQKADKKLAEWKAKPAEIRYNVIYKIRKVKSNECKQIKAVINSIRSINYTDL